jgi:hypothetical protein
MKPPEATQQRSEALTAALREDGERALQAGNGFATGRAGGSR